MTKAKKISSILAFCSFTVGTVTQVCIIDQMSQNISDSDYDSYYSRANGLGAVFVDGNVVVHMENSYDACIAVVVDTDVSDESKWCGFVDSSARPGTTGSWDNTFPDTFEIPDSDSEGSRINAIGFDSSTTDGVANINQLMLPSDQRAKWNGPITITGGNSISKIETGSFTETGDAEYISKIKRMDIHNMRCTGSGSQAQHTSPLVIQSGAFSSSTSLESFNVYGPVSTIASDAFSETTNLAGITLWYRGQYDSYFPSNLYTNRTEKVYLPSDVYGRYITSGKTNDGGKIAKIPLSEISLSSDSMDGSNCVSFTNVNAGNDATHYSTAVLNTEVNYGATLATNENYVFRKNPSYTSETDISSAFNVVNGEAACVLLSTDVDTNPDDVYSAQEISFLQASGMAAGAYHLQVGSRIGTANPSEYKNFTVTINGSSTPTPAYLIIKGVENINKKVNEQISTPILSCSTDIGDDSSLAPTFSIVGSEQLPDGLELNANTGVISGKVSEPIDTSVTLHAISTTAALNSNDHDVTVHIKITGTSNSNIFSWWVILLISLGGVAVLVGLATLIEKLRFSSKGKKHSKK